MDHTPLLGVRTCTLPPDGSARVSEEPQTHRPPNRTPPPRRACDWLPTSSVILPGSWASHHLLLPILPVQSSSPLGVIPIPSALAAPATPLQSGSPSTAVPQTHCLDRPRFQRLQASSGPPHSIRSPVPPASRIPQHRLTFTSIPSLQKIPAVPQCRRPPPFPEPPRARGLPAVPSCTHSCLFQRLWARRGSCLCPGPSRVLSSRTHSHAGACWYSAAWRVGKSRTPDRSLIRPTSGLFLWGKELGLYSRKHLLKHVAQTVHNDCTHTDYPFPGFCKSKQNPKESFGRDWSLQKPGRVACWVPPPWRAGGREC